jgi:8-oxo-dGTP diphosphatase
MECQHPRVGVGVLVVRNNLLLLGKRCGKHMPGYYAAPGGHLETGESFVQCARREILEETGLRATDVRLLCIGHYKFGDRQYVDIDMIATCPDGDPLAKEPDKCAEWSWYEMDSLPSPLFVVTKRMIDSYLSGCVTDDAAINDILSQTC